MNKKIHEVDVIIARFQTTACKKTWNFQDWTGLNPDLYDNRVVISNFQAN